MDDGIIPGILLVLAVLAALVLIVIAIARAIVHAVRNPDGREDPFANPRWFMFPTLSLTDLLRQLYAVIGISLVVTALTLVAQLAGLAIPPRHLALVGCALAIAGAYFQKAPLLLGFGVLGAFGWWLAVAESASTGVSARLAIIGFALLGCIAWLLGRTHDAERDSRRAGFVYWVLGAAALVWLLFGASSYDSANAFVGVRASTVRGVELWAWLAVLVVLLAGAVWLALRRRAVLIPELGWLLGLAALFVVFAATPEASDNLWAAIFSAVLLASLVALAYLGFARREDWLVTVSAILLFVFVVVKYFDWVFTFMDRSLAFVVAGLLFIGFGFAMERGRRRILAAMEEPGAHA